MSEKAFERLILWDVILILLFRWRRVILLDLGFLYVDNFERERNLRFVKCGFCYLR